MSLLFFTNRNRRPDESNGEGLTELLESGQCIMRAGLELDTAVGSDDDATGVQEYQPLPGNGVMECNAGHINSLGIQVGGNVQS